MLTKGEKLLPLVSEISSRLDQDLSLGALSRKAGWSSAYLQRQFTGFVGESPKQYTHRIRLEAAAAELIATETSVVAIALNCGFASHEVFSRAFKRRFGSSPQAFRAATRLVPSQRIRYREMVNAVGPCITLYRVSATKNEATKNMPTTVIERKELETAQPILFIQRRIPLTQLQPTMAECFGTLYGHGQKHGLAIAGQPIARYVSTGAGLWTVDFAMPLLTGADSVGEMQAGSLASGPVAFAIHKGPYDQLPETNAAIEKWIEEKGYRYAGAPWECYVTDPGQTPDPADWKTEVYWPLLG